MLKQQSVLNYHTAEIARQRGCTATTVSGIIRFIKNKNIKWNGYENFFNGRFVLPALYNYRKSLPGHDARKTHRYVAVKIFDGVLRSVSYAAVKNAHPRKRNWTNPEPTVSPEGHHTCKTTARHQYGWNYYRYTPLYHSCVFVYRSGKTIEYYREQKLFRRIFAPAGLTFGADSLGVFVKSKDGTDYHLTTDDLQNKKFAQNVRAKLHEKRLSVRRQKKTERATQKYLEVKNKQLVTCRVNLDDSLKSGNCLEGTLKFAELRLGIDRKTLIEGRHLVHVSGEKLLKTNDWRAKNAVERAWMRETTVCI